jgi:hypothetical protein
VVWKRLDGQRTLQEIVAGVEDSFSDVPDTVFAEVSAFVTKLAEQGFLGRTPGDSAA